MAPQNVLITAAGGHIGKELIPLLINKVTGLKLVLPTSNADRLRSSLDSGLSGNPNICIEQGSIQDPRWFQQLLQSHAVDTIFLCLTGADELFTTMNIFDCIVRAGTVKHVVYLSACADMVSQEGIALVMKSCTAAHVLVKTTIEQKLAYGNFPFSWTILGPSLFFINDLRSKTSLMEKGWFDEPLGEKGVSRVCPSDIALAARNSIFDQGARFGGRKIMIGSKRMYKGSEVAALWSDALGKKIEMQGSGMEDLDQFEAHFSAKLGGVPVGNAWGRDLRLMYELFAKVGFGMTEDQYHEQVELLGKEAEDYEGWVRKVAGSWKSE
jgi:uncharacterized protein YbjT (DUF2867 family)